MRLWRLVPTAIVVAGVCGILPRGVQAAAALELYGTFEAMGVIVGLDAGDDPDGDATALVEYRQPGSGAYQLGRR